MAAEDLAASKSKAPCLSSGISSVDFGASSKSRGGRWDSAGVNAIARRSSSLMPMSRDRAYYDQ